MNKVELVALRVFPVKTGSCHNQTCGPNIVQIRSGQRRPRPKRRPKPNSLLIENFKGRRSNNNNKKGQTTFRSSGWWAHVRRTAVHPKPLSTAVAPLQGQGGNHGRRVFALHGGACWFGRWWRPARGVTIPVAWGHCKPWWVNGPGIP